MIISVLIKLLLSSTRNTQHTVQESAISRHADVQ